MRNYEQEWRALETRRRAIDAELGNPEISREWRNVLERQKTKVEACEKELIRKATSDDGREYESGRSTDQNGMFENDVKSSTDEIDRSQIRQTRLRRDHLRDLEIKQWAERQRD